MSQLPISNIVNISVLEAQAGVGDFNTSNLGLFTHEVPGETFGDDGFKQYIDPIDVGTDFGTDSRTYQMALAIFSQQPNILTGGGQLVVILMNNEVVSSTAVETLSFSSLPTSGSFKVAYGADASTAINFGDTASDVQTAIRTISGLGSVTVTGNATTGFVVTMTGVSNGARLFSIVENSLQDTDDNNVVVTPAISVYGAPATAVQSIDFSTVPTVGSYKLKYGALTTGSIAYNDNATAVQTALRLLTGLGSVTVAGDTTDGFEVTFTGVSGPATLLEVSNNSLQDTDGFDVELSFDDIIVGLALADGETLAEAITRTANLVQYFGVMETAPVAEQTEENVLAAAAVIQALVKIGFFVSSDSADIEPGGTLDLLATGGFTKSRGLYYGDDTDDAELIMMASYGGRGLSTNFTGSNTTSTMNLKDLAGVQPDPSMTQTLYNKAEAAGADIYASLQGVPKVISFGANKYFDQVYNLQAYIAALQVAGFNFLAQAATKVPQTESGMDGLKGAYRNVCEQFVTNQYIAPGSWTSPTLFGNPANLIANIAQVGYYIFSQPISQQSQTARAAREAPLIQIAIKEAGAIQESTVIVNVNA